MCLRTDPELPDPLSEKLDQVGDVSLIERARMFHRKPVDLVPWIHFHGRHHTPEESTDSVRPACLVYRCSQLFREVVVLEKGFLLFRIQL
jgi:hypothetical protein